MGCTSSIYLVGKKKRKIVPEVSMFVPFLRVPAQTDIHRTLGGLVPKDLANRINSLRNQISFVADHTGGTAISELIKALEEYLPLVIGLTKKGSLLCVVFIFVCRQLIASLIWASGLGGVQMERFGRLKSGNLCGKHMVRTTLDCMRDAVDLLLKAAGHLNFCVHDVIPRLPPDVKDKLPSDMQGSVLESILYQALAMGTEVQVGLAVQSQNATLSVKRRLACEQLSFFTKAYFCLSEADNGGARKKQLSFLKWKHLEAKAGAYYYHALILDKGTEPSSHVSAVCCFIAAQDLLAESNKACLTFCLAHPITRATPPWGAMKHFHKKIPDMASKKSQMYADLLDQENLQSLPHLPEFELSLKPDDYELPQLDPMWDFGNWKVPNPGQTTIKAHLNDDDDHHHHLFQLQT
ncbi:endosomal targeting BRO1-like domain-containing protein [Striga asiatica]|uniref:Endosomal targeting BRO1-like domain-containing protein n=1 Tax=Striga asiatica TaxID=4170 RepID=A0A5A7Q226_STRAF|nr:endosomal targeting BRO1-like domain-containing protein [Striga asiatica]